MNCLKTPQNARSVALARGCGIVTQSMIIALIANNMEKPPMREVDIALCDVCLIRPSNDLIDKQKVWHMMEEGIDPIRLKALPAYWNGEYYHITDGNHRLAACIASGWEYVPIIELTKAEYDYVKYSTNELDIIVHETTNPRIIKK